MKLKVYHGIENYDFEYGIVSVTYVIKQLNWNIKRNI